MLGKKKRPSDKRKSNKNDGNIQSDSNGLDLKRRKKLEEENISGDQQPPETSEKTQQ